MKVIHLREIHKRNNVDEIETELIDDIPTRILKWIQSNVQCPIFGFNHKRNPDGTYYSQEQQLRASHEQLMLIALDCFDRGYPPQKIIETLRYFRR